MNKVLWVFLIILIASCDNEESSTARNMDKETGEIISVEKPFQQDSFPANCKAKCSHYQQCADS
jgi:hypothetical protein